MLYLLIILDQENCNVLRGFYCLNLTGGVSLFFAVFILIQEVYKVRGNSSVLNGSNHFLRYFLAG